MINDEINIQNDEIKFIPLASISSNAKKVLFEIMIKCINILVFFSKKVYNTRTIKQRGA